MDIFSRVIRQLRKRRIGRAVLAGMRSAQSRAHNAWLDVQKPHPFDPKREVIWIKTPKTAGSSIQRALEDAGYLRMMRPGKRAITGVYSGRLEEFIDKYPEAWVKSYKFSIVRNPYDKFVSAWRYLETTKEREILDVLRNLPKPTEKYGDYTHLTLTQTELLYRDGNSLVDEVLSYENLQEDLDKFLEGLGLPPLKLPVVNAGKYRTSNYSKYFDERSREVFLNRYDADFFNFGYDPDDL